MKQGYTHGHPYVEIGGVKWATMNVGAKDVTDSGLYFAWGETKGYTLEEFGKTKRFTWGDYKFGKPDRLYKYKKKDKLKTLQPQDDPVHANWRGGWRLPTKEEFERLDERTNHSWVDNYKGSGVAGLVLRDKTDPNKQLFFPAAGKSGDGAIYGVGSSGHYWGSSIHADLTMLAYDLFFNNRGIVNLECYNGRCLGFSVRGVLD